MPAVAVYYCCQQFFSITMFLGNCRHIHIHDSLPQFSGSSFCDLGSLFGHFVHPVQFSIRALASNTVTISFTVVLLRERSQM